MKIKDFGVEMWMNAYENDCTYNLAETCVESLTVEQLLELGGCREQAVADILGMKLTYGAIEGSPRLRTLIAGLYEKTDAGKCHYGARGYRRESSCDRNAGRAGGRGGLRAAHVSAALFHSGGAGC